MPVDRCAVPTRTPPAHAVPTVQLHSYSSLPPPPPTAGSGAALVYAVCCWCRCGCGRTWSDALAWAAGSVAVTPQPAACSSEAPRSGMLTAVGGGGRRACGGSCADGRGITRPWRRSAAHHRCRRRNHRPYVLSVLRPRVLTCSAPLRSPISASRHPFSRATVAVSPAPPPAAIAPQATSTSAARC